MKKNIFRKASLERLSSPEQLDQLMQITNPKGWIALLGISALLVLAIIWSITGSLPTNINGQGILIKTGGVFDITSMGNGRVVDVAVRVGEEVQAGQVVARLEQPELMDEIKRTKAQLQELRAQRTQEQAFDQREIKLRLEYLTKQQENQQQSIQIGEQRLIWLQDKMEAQQELLDEGLITKQALIDTQQRLFSSQEELDQGKNQLRQIELEMFTLRSGKEQQAMTRRFEINDVERHIAQLEEEMRLRSRIVSPYTGRVLEVTIAKGDFASKGTSVLTLDLVGREIKDLEAVIYVPAQDGKKVKLGMEIRIAPSTVKQEEYGYMLGRVTYVSDYPATPNGMLSMLKNDKLIQALAGSSAPYEIRADLFVDPVTESGFRWTSSGGPPVRIQSGTLCTSNIIIERRRPIELVLPILRGYLRM